MKKLSSDELSIFKEILEHKISRNQNRDYQLLGELESCLKGHLERSFYVDEFPDFKAALSTSFKMKSEKNIGYLDSVIICYGESEEGLKKLLLGVQEINWSIPLLIYGLKAVLSVLKEVVRQKAGELKEVFNAGCLHANLEHLRKWNLPEGYTLSQLTPWDAPIIVENWPFGAETGITAEYIGWLIETYQSIAVHYKTNQLVAYMIQRHDHDLGFLRVHPDHRQKGIAKVVVTELAKKVLQCKQPAYVYIENDISVKLHEKCGFQKLCDMVFVIYKPSVVKSAFQ